MKLFSPACNVEAYARSQTKNTYEHSKKTALTTQVAAGLRSSDHERKIQATRYEIHLCELHDGPSFFKFIGWTCQFCLPILRAIFGEFAACWLALGKITDRQPNHAGQVGDQRFVADLLAPRCERSSGWIKVLPLFTVFDFWIIIGTTIMEPESLDCWWIQCQCHILERFFRLHRWPYPMGYTMSPLRWSWRWYSAGFAWPKLICIRTTAKWFL